MTAQPTAQPRATLRYAAAKVPEITAVFWVIKVLTTGMGEAASDYLGNTSLVLAGVIGIFGFAAAMWIQLRSDRYRPVVYWVAVAMVAVTGTMCADVLHVILGVPYQITSAFYGLALAAVFILWWRSERTLSIHSITTRRRELFYWVAVGASFAMGTAVGDLTAFTMHLGFLTSGWLFLAAIAIPFVAWRWFGLAEVPAFWIAYVLTRPLGASFADWVGKPGGLNLGDGTVTFGALVVFALLVAWVVRSEHGIQPDLDEEFAAFADEEAADPI